MTCNKLYSSDVKRLKQRLSVRPTLMPISDRRLPTYLFENNVLNELNYAAFIVVVWITSAYGLTNDNRRPEEYTVSLLGYNGSIT